LAQKQKRIRRRPEEAKSLILDAAEASMKAGGPAALRLQDVARAAGVSHPTILHHFGSREGLVRALNLRSLEALTAGVIERMGEAKSGDEGIKRTFETYRDGLAQRTIWLLQSQEAPPPQVNVTMFEDIVQGLHAIRQCYALPGHVPDIEDTRSVVHLTTIAAFGDALIGPRLRNVSGPQEEAQRDRFIQWFAGLLDMYFDAAR
jgi:AcrR family transcriptional regulator